MGEPWDRQEVMKRLRTLSDEGNEFAGDVLEKIEYLEQANGDLIEENRKLRGVKVDA